MTIFHVIQYKGHRGHVGEYPKWVMDQFREWSSHREREEACVHRYLDLLLEEYDPETHGDVMHGDISIYVLLVTAMDLHYLLSPGRSKP